MPVVTSIQRRPPNDLSGPKFANYDTFVECKEFTVKLTTGVDGKEVIEAFFPRSGAPEQGVGLIFASQEVAISVGRALLTVAEGHSREVTSRF